ncbi:hypothetical protein ACLOJK_004792 [Asimina triloba]
MGSARSVDGGLLSGIDGCGFGLLIVQRCSSCCEWLVGVRWIWPDRAVAVGCCRWLEWLEWSVGVGWTVACGLAMGKTDDEDGADRCCPDDIDGDNCRRAGARSSTDGDDSRTELMVGRFAAGGRRVDGEMGFNPSEFGRSCWPRLDHMDPGH